MSHIFLPKPNFSLGNCLAYHRGQAKGDFFASDDVMTSTQKPPERQRNLPVIEHGSPPPLHFPRYNLGIFAEKTTAKRGGWFQALFQVNMLMNGMGGINTSGDVCLIVARYFKSATGACGNKPHHNVTMEVPERRSYLAKVSTFSPSERAFNKLMQKNSPAATTASREQRK